MGDAICTRFEAFVEGAKPLLESSAVLARSEDLAQFAEFVASAEELLYRDAKAYIAWLSDAIAPLEPSLAAYDILSVARVTSDENSYTELLAWTLWPPGNVQLAKACQRAWLRHAAGIEPAEAVKPHTQFWTDDGIPDLVLPYSEHPVIVEAKTGSHEHETPRSGRMQTVAYPPAVRRALGFAADGPMDMIFLTTDRAAPANGQAKAISYLETALAIAGVVEHAEISDQLLAAYRIVLGHLAIYAVPAGVDMSEVLKAVHVWRSAVDNVDATRIAPFSKALARCECVLPIR